MFIGRMPSRATPRSTSTAVTRSVGATGCADCEIGKTAGGSVHDDDLIVAVVRLLSQVRVIEVGRALVSEDDTHVTAIPGRGRAFHPGVEHEVTERKVLDQREVERTAMRRLVSTLLELA